MPPRTAKIRDTLTADEQRFIRHYVREGATEDRVAKAARKAGVTAEVCRRMLLRTHVQVEIESRKSLLKFEQARLDAQDLNRREGEDDARVRVTEDKIYKQLNALIEADPKTLTSGHKLKADFLKLALVVTGTIRDGRTERLMPVDDAGGRSTGPVVYQSLFERQAQQAAPVDEQPAELYPEPPPTPTGAQEARKELANAPANNRVKTAATATAKPNKYITTPPAAASEPQPILEVPVKRK